MTEIFYVLAIFFLLSVIIGQEYSHRDKYKDLENEWIEQEKHISELIAEKNNYKFLTKTKLNSYFFDQFVKSTSVNVQSIKFDKIKGPEWDKEADNFFKVTVKYSKDL